MIDQNRDNVGLAPRDDPGGGDGPLGNDVGTYEGPWAVLCDFDGTISTVDTTDSLLRRFARSGWTDIESQWEQGRIGSRVCMTRQVAMLDMSVSDLLAHLDGIGLDPAFASFVASARASDMPVEILSDGLEQAILIILARHGIRDIPVYANHLMQTSERSWQLATPHARRVCVPDSAHCKCSQLGRLARRTLYIGDGSSDFCVAAKADYVFAKGRLADYCRDRGIAHCRIAGFEDALGLLARFKPAVPA